MTGAKARWVAAVLVSVLAWRVGVAMYDEVARVADSSWSDRCERFLADDDTRLRWTLGRHYEVHAALAEHVVPGSHVWVFTPETGPRGGFPRRALVVLGQAEVLHFPTSFMIHVGPIAIADVVGDALGPSSYVVSLRPSQPFPMQEWFERMASGKAFELWRALRERP